MVEWDRIFLDLGLERETCVKRKIWRLLGGMKEMKTCCAMYLRDEERECNSSKLKVDKEGSVKAFREAWMDFSELLSREASLILSDVDRIPSSPASSDLFHSFVLALLQILDLLRYKSKKGRRFHVQSRTNFWQASEESEVWSGAERNSGALDVLSEYWPLLNIPFLWTLQTSCFYPNMQLLSLYRKELPR